MTKQFMAWVGCGATCGTPHKVTGRHDKHGELKIFSSKKERDEYCNKFNYKYNSCPVPTNKKEAKALYFAGCTQGQYQEHLSYIGC